MGDDGLWHGYGYGYGYWKRGGLLLVDIMSYCVARGWWWNGVKVL
jgi:hypothetical protein